MLWHVRPAIPILAGPGQGFGSRAAKKEVWKLVDAVQMYMEPPSALHEFYEKTIVPTFGATLSRRKRRCPPDNHPTQAFPAI